VENDLDRVLFMENSSPSLQDISAEILILLDLSSSFAFDLLPLIVRKYSSGELGALLGLFSLKKEAKGWS
jgi:hypothetical protein